MEYNKYMKENNEMLLDFINKAFNLHNGKYDYSKVSYINSRTKVCIICPEHGEFWQTPHNHLKGNGCPKCGRIKSDEARTKTNEEFVNKANKIHNGKYDYSKVVYKKWNEKVCIICHEHGEFLQTPSNHLNGCGCPHCANDKRSDNKTYNVNEVIELANKVHNNYYSYSKVEYLNSKTKICIVCPKHGEFWQTSENHLRGQGCPKCANVISKNEDEIVNLLQPLDLIRRDREILNGKEIDIYIPSLKLGIEYNGLRWHSEEFGKDKNYHINKLNECNEKKIRLIQIFEDEWINHRDICESKLKQICGLNNNPKIYGRKCEIRLIGNKDDAYKFLDKNHIQGRTGFTVGLGCYYNDNLIGVMTFKREKEGHWDLNRFATDINYQCIGIGGKLFKYFTTHYEFQEVKSFADRRWTINPTDNLYTKLGFEFDSFVKPTYWYYKNGLERHHKFGFRKNTLQKKYNLPLKLTELEMSKQLGYTRIWDCGLIKYIFKRN